MTKPKTNNPESKDIPAQKSSQAIMQSLITGSVAGGVEVLIDHPLWSIKTRMQCGDPFTLNPRLLYRGILPNAASMIPITAIQVGLDQCFKSIFFNDDRELSSYLKVSSAFVAGASSALASCPTERVMTRQKKTGEGFYAAGKYLFTNNGWRGLYQGLPITTVREGIFTAFFLAGTPIIKAEIQPSCPNEDAASLIAGMSSGLGATLVSQAADTLKTIQQDVEGHQHVSLRVAAKELYARQGLYGFFKGTLPRGARVMSAVTIMGYVTEKMEKQFQQQDSESRPSIT